MADREYFELLWGRIFVKLEITVHGQCWLWTGGKTNPGGVPYSIMRVKYPGSIVGKGTQSCLYGENRDSDPPERPRCVVSCAAICDSLCCNPDNLSMEIHYTIITTGSTVTDVLYFFGYSLKIGLDFVSLYCNVMMAFAW